MTSSLPRNQIICGDALHVLRRLPDKSIDLVVTDPPYGDNTSYGIHNRTIAGNEHPLVALAVMAECYRVLKANTSAYMFCGSRHLGFLRSFFQNYTKYGIRDVVIWDKMLRGRGHGFRRQYECILVLEKGKPRYRSPGLSNVLRFQRARAIRHPHEKPVELIETLIRQSSDERAVVLDPFLGSGTTAVAAQRLNRYYVGVELDHRYYAVAEQRLQQISEVARAA
jgi:site-specific DNA-methyltransferase (adenine-specific)